jgi:hypothetical protein
MNSKFIPTQLKKKLFFCIAEGKFCPVARRFFPARFELCGRNIRSLENQPHLKTGSGPGAVAFLLRRYKYGSRGSRAIFEIKEKTIVPFPLR